MGSIEERTPCVKPKLKDQAMFTGLVDRIGTISAVETVAEGKRIAVQCPVWQQPITIGESICISGCCLSVATCSKQGEDQLIGFDVVPESISCSNLGSLKIGKKVNIERSLQAQSFLGGHFVQGHIDGVGNVLAVNAESDGDVRLRISTENVDSDTIVSKGSVALDGVSVTIASFNRESLEVALIPITLQETTLGSLQVGDSVNIETDVIAKTVAQVVRNMHVT